MKDNEVLEVIKVVQLRAIKVNEVLEVIKVIQLRAMKDNEVLEVIKVVQLLLAKWWTNKSNSVLLRRVIYINCILFFCL